MTEHFCKSTDDAISLLGPEYKKSGLPFGGIGRRQSRTWRQGRSLGHRSFSDTVRMPVVRPTGFSSFLSSGAEKNKNIDEGRLQQDKGKYDDAP